MVWEELCMCGRSPGVVAGARTDGAVLAIGFFHHVRSICAMEYFVGE